MRRPPRAVVLRPTAPAATVVGPTPSVVPSPPFTAPFVATRPGPATFTPAGPSPLGASGLPTVPTRRPTGTLLDGVRLAGLGRRLAPRPSPGLVRVGAATAPTGVGSPAGGLHAARTHVVFLVAGEEQAPPTLVGLDMAPRPAPAVVVQVAPAAPFPTASSSVPPAPLAGGLPPRGGPRRVLGGTAGLAGGVGLAPVGRRPPEVAVLRTAGVGPQGPGLGPPVVAGLVPAALQTDTGTEGEEVDAVDHLGSPVVGTVTPSPGVVGVGPRVPALVVGLRSPVVGRPDGLAGARVGAPRPFPVPILAPRARPLGRVPRPWAVGPFGAPAPSSKEGPAKAPAALAAPGAVPSSGAVPPGRLVSPGVLGLGGTPFPVGGRETRPATGGGVRPPPPGAEATVGTRTGGLAPVPVGVRRVGVHGPGRLAGLAH